ncbi:hypothetical protein C8Q74DRAFT_1364698 [Fomes fomentarius]|nr:hypothetical protein C8Q74DRAFT_1364698 [Fomes fomentarius]
MPELSSIPPDARTLFSPVPIREDGSEPNSDAPALQDTSLSVDDASPQLRVGALVADYVDVPRLSMSQRSKYRPVADQELKSDEEYPHEKVEQVVGDVTYGNEHFYYVRYADGIVHKVPAYTFNSHHSEFAQEYEDSLAMGHIPPFDPTSSDVHPASRTAALTVRIPGLGSRRRRDPTPGESSSDELTRDVDSTDYSDDTSGYVHRRSTRSAAASAHKKLGSDFPSSPKKTRSGGRAISVHGSDSDSDIQELAPPTRKSARNRITKRSNVYDEDFEDYTESDESGTGAKIVKKRKIVRGKASRPAYGHFRVVADLLHDEEENEDIAPLLVHRSICEKCHTAPTHEQLKRRKKGRKRKSKEDDLEDEDSRLDNLGGWVRCLKCPVAAHWGCLAKTQRDEILRAAHERDKAEMRVTNPDGPEPGGICMGCREVALKPDQFAERARSTYAPNEPPPTSSAPVVEPAPPAPTEKGCDDIVHELLFRCFTCKRLAHYAHLPVPDGYDPDDTPVTELASYYQYETGWKCADCASYVYVVEHILAWRPYPEDAVEPTRAPNEYPNHKAMLPREYLVKWVDRSYRRVQWVPHGWLLAVASNKLRNFLVGGSKVTLLPEPGSEQQHSATEENVTAFEIGRDGIEDQQGMKDGEETKQLTAIPDAEKRIPPAWRTVDRVLDIRLWRSSKVLKGKKKKRMVSFDDEDDVTSEVAEARDQAHNQGEEPPSHLMVSIEEYESHVGRELNETDASRVAWAFFKWDDLGYDDASWDSPPRSGEIDYAAYEKAFARFIFAESVTVPKRDKKRPPQKKGAGWLRREAFTCDSQPDLGQDPQLKLMPFQVDGVNWLCHNWNIDQNCILADEMGLGKTVQIVTFIGHLVANFDAFPALVVVPNSTITNWVREFERWAPKLRVVPFYGEAKAREVIKKYELYHAQPPSGTTGAKYHVLVTTYETVTNPKEFGVIFKNTPRWELLVVDEGQRLKSDESLIFKRLKELKSFHRIIMTGTPLNNNIRELFNLMNFLDPDEWRDLEALSKQYEELTDELVKDLHGRLKPYFLRRIKSEVLQLPPKNEVIVPVSMAPLQKEIYRSVLSQNLEILRSLAEGNATSSKGNNAVTKTNMNNVLMQLRKCLQHPYLVSDTIEPKDLSPQETHERLVGASAKLRLLKMLLPRLRARGHRVLLFSQFVLALDVVEDFLVGEGIKFLRLDGNTKQAERQKGMDEFNKPDSDVFIYILTTRAGGVGINLWSADTVIIFDPDFNPHQDLQAIARAHRYGQKKTVLVFKLMVKDSAEERIMQTGKRKLVLDHLIVQKMDDENGSKEDVQSILMFGAQALFQENEESAAQEVHYSEHDIENLIEKTEKEGEEVEPESGAGSLFSFAKVWSAEKEVLEDMDEPTENTEATDSWAKALELIAARKATELQKEVTGRGVRRKAAAVFPQQSLHLGDTPTKDKNKEKNKSKKRKKSKGKSTGSDDSDFHAPLLRAGSDSDDTEDDMDVDDIRMLPVPEFGSITPMPPMPVSKQKHKVSEVQHRPLSPIHNRRQESDSGAEFCGLCGKDHAPSHCSMTESPENLAQYRLMLMQHAGDETIEERRAAIRVIDETLHRLGKIHLIYGQPLQLVEVPSHPTPQRPANLQNPSKRPKKGPHPTTQTSPRTVIPRDNVNNGAQPTAGPSRLNGAPQPNPAPTAVLYQPKAARISKTTNSVPNSSKRPSPPTDSILFPATKKLKESGAPNPCVVCGGPYHLVKDCPVVAQGSPSSITEAIERLSKNPAQAPVVSILESIWTKLQRRALSGSATKDPSGASGSAIDLTK